MEKLENGLHLGSLDKFITLIYDQTATLFDYFPQEESLLLFSEGNKLKERVRTTLWQWGEDVKDYLAEGVLCKGLDLYSQDWEYALEYASKASALFLDVFARGSYEVPVKALLNMTAKQLSVWGAARSCSVKTSPLSLPRGRACVVLAGTERAAETLAEDLKQSGLPASHWRALPLSPRALSQ